MFGGRFTIRILHAGTPGQETASATEPVWTSPRKKIKSFVLTGIERRRLSLLVGSPFNISNDPASQILREDDIEVDVKK